MRLSAWKLVFIPASLIVLLSAALLPAAAQTWPNGYSYRRTVTIDHTKVPNTSALNFPVLISGTYSYLATTGSGGNVTNSSGYDIVFTSDAAGSTTLAFEQGIYNSTTGAVNYWVKVPKVSHSYDTVIYMFYGNSSVTTDQSNKNGTWDSHFEMVQHLPNGTTLTANDSSSNGFNGTVNGATAVTGMIDGGAGLSGSSQYITMGNVMNIGSGAMTMEAWLKAPNSNAFGDIVAKRKPSASWQQYQFLIGYVDGSGNGVSGKMIGFFATDGTNDDSYYTTNNIVDGNWHHVAITRNSSGSVAIYADGASQTLTTVNTPSSPPNSDNTSNFDIGYDNGSAYLNASVDEVRVSNTNRSADWIATEYNNQSSPSTFYSLGSAQAGVSAPSITSLSITSGSVGNSVTITGTNFGSTQGTSTVSFNGTAATATSWSATSIATTVPTGASTGGVVVTVSGLNSSGVTFTVAGGSAWSNGYNYRRVITIDQTRVPNSDQSSFPVLVSGTYSDLATTGNGGYVTNSNGYDVIFTSDGAGASTLPFEQESYSASTGQLVYWVQVPTVSHTADTTIYMFYGNSSVTTDQSNKNGTWDSHYKGVWHLPNGTTLTANDSTSNGNNGTVHGTVTAVSGQADGAGSFDGSTGYISTTNTFNWPLSSTNQVWIKTTSTGGHPATDLENNQTGTGTIHYDSELYVDSTGKAQTTCWVGSVVTVASSAAVNDGSWHQLTSTLDMSTNLMKLYVDGVSQGTANCSGVIAQDTFTGYLRIGSYKIAGWPNSNDGYFNGQIDEVRYSNIVRSADWVTTEYNNQSSPSTFYSVGSAQTDIPTPQITSLSPTSGAVGASVTITGTSFGPNQAAGSSTVTFNGTPATATAWASTSITVTVPSGATTGNAVVTASGNASSGTSFTVLPTPSITVLSRASGVVGAAVTITGVNFGASQGSGTLTFNGTTATITSWSATSIVTSVPSGATTGNVVVYASGVNSNGPSFTVLAAANISSLSRTSGYVGIPVTVTGTNFGSSQTAAGGAVSFNGTTATITSWTSTSIGTLVPSGATTGNVVVTANGGTSNGVSFSVASPTITSLSPTSGAVSASVTITGTNFGSSQGASTITFGGTSATVSSWGATSITASVPTGASTGNVLVTVSGVPSNGAVFAVTAALSGSVTQTGGTAISGASIQVLQNGASKGSATSASDGSYSVSSLATGSYDVKFSASSFGTVLQSGVSVSASGTTLNQTLVTPGTISGQVTQSNGTTVISGATITIVQSGESISTATSNGSGNYSVSNLSAGSYSVEASDTGYVTQGVDSVSVTSGTATTENFSLDAGGTLPINYFYDSSGRLVGVVDTAGDAAGYSYDSVGNLLAITRGTSRQTSVISFSPSKGPVGTAVTIYGTGFSTTTSSDSVSFNGTSATVTAATTTSISVTVPSGATTGTISVTSPNGTAASATNFTVTSSLGVPTITSFSPTIGTAGTSITVTGTNYDSTAANDRLRFNYETSSTVTTSASSTSLTSSVPSGATSGHISVAAPAGSTVSSGDFFVPPGSHVASDVVLTGRISLNGNITVPITTAGTIGLIVFDATAGQKISVNFTSETITAFGAAIYSPSGSVLYNYGSLGDCCGYPLPYIDVMTLPATGTYTIMISGYSTYTGSVTVNLYGFTDVTGTFTPGGSPVNVTTTAPGQNAYYTFSGTAGQMIFFEFGPSYSGGTANISLLNPDGSVNASSSGSGGTIHLTSTRITLGTTGTYTVFVDPQSNAVGTTTLTLYNVVDSTGGVTVNGSGVTVTLATPGQYGYLTFSGTSGQLLTVHVTGNSMGGVTVGLEEGSTVLTSVFTANANFSLSQQTLPATDTYTVFIKPDNGGTGSMTSVSVTSP
jgi:YD repeat-containing protein